MKSMHPNRSKVSESPAGGAIRLIALILTSAAIALAQSPASITTIPQPTAGRPVFDASGNTYYLYGPPPVGATVPLTSGGACLGQTGLHGPGPVPCPPLTVTKVDPSGNQIWSAQIKSGLPTLGTALAVVADGRVAFTGSAGGANFPRPPA